MKLYPVIAPLACLASLVLTTCAFCGEPLSETPKAPAMDTFNAEVSQTFQSEFKRGHGYDSTQKDNNNTNTWHYSVEAAHRLPLNGNWYLKLGINLNRYDFGDNHSVAPNTLQSYAAGIGLEYRVAGRLRFYVESKPGLYFSHDLTGKSFDAPTALALFYPICDGSVVLVGGFRASILSKYPILPAGGFIWHINPVWDLQAVAPRPRLVFKANENTRVYAGGELVGGSFRVDSNSDRPQLNATVVDYHEIRVGSGLSYKPCAAGSLDLGAGYAVVRKFDFHRADQTVSTQPAPYLRLQFSGEF